jgi:hypothetical protein
MKKNNFKAPQKSLVSSWRDECFSKPKVKGTIIKRSLSLRATPIGKLNGSLIASSSFGTSNDY